MRGDQKLGLLNRGLSASAADDARVEREKLFRLRSDRPTHRPRDPMGFGRLVWNCSGILNWTVLLLILVAIKMFLENLNKYGVRINPSLWFSAAFGELDNDRREYPAIPLLLFINIPLQVALRTEQWVVQGKLDWCSALSIHTSNLLLLLVVPVACINQKSEDIGLMSSIIVCCSYTCLFMKLVSYIQVNKWCRDSMIENNNNQLFAGKRNNLPSMRSPILCKTKIMEAAASNGQQRRRFYSVTPLCGQGNLPPPVPVVEITKTHSTESVFQDSLDGEFEEYSPNEKGDNERTTSSTSSERRNRRSVYREPLSEPEKCLDATLTGAGHQETTYSVASTEVIYPDNLTARDIYYFWLAPTLCYETNFPRTRRIRKTFLGYRALEVFICSNICLCIWQQYILPLLAHALVPFSNMELSIASERLLKLALPNHLLWLIGFYLLFHSFLNSTAEILQFADRSFFSDWWNAANLETFWKTWNLPVHRWCVRHVYKPLLSYGWSKTSSMVAVFLMSAFFHEYLVSVPLRMFKVWVGLGMMAQIPLVIMSSTVERKFGARFGNMIVWLSLIIGQPLAIMMYYHDFVVTHYGDHLVQKDNQ